MQMKPLLAVCYPLKGRTSVTLPRVGGVFAEIANLHSLPSVCSEAPAFVPAFIRRPWHKRAYNVQWISERNAGLFREQGTYFIPASCRVAIKLRGAINHLRQCEEIDFADKWTRVRRTGRLRNSFPRLVPNKLPLATEIDSRPQAKLLSANARFKLSKICSVNVNVSVCYHACCLWLGMANDQTLNIRRPLSKLGIAQSYTYRN